MIQYKNIKNPSQKMILLFNNMFDYIVRLICWAVEGTKVSQHPVYYILILWYTFMNIFFCPFMWFLCCLINIVFSMTIQIPMFILFPFLLNFFFWLHIIFWTVWRQSNGISLLLNIDFSLSRNGQKSSLFS